ncbi:MAG: hypothetical protein VSS75_029905 [Candidatus Parabeggiatoa sp.]|nr:hypothetical protein [Candidatus Parabeggiatoa sp.]
MKGTHGTCSSHADLIRANGFRYSNVGLRGGGVYFWAYTLDNIETYARDLAIAWWQFAKKRGDYAKAAKQNCSVIFTHLNVESQDILDFEDQQVREKFVVYAQKVYDKIEGKTKEEKISIVYDLFVGDLEKTIGKTFSMLHVKVQAPNTYKKRLPIDLTGQPSCYVVKNSSCIQINQFEEFDNG